MRIFWGFLLTIAASLAAAKNACAPPVWAVDLVQKYQFRNFGQAGFSKWPPNTWEMQQGVVFISPELLAIYQVSPNNSSPAVTPRSQKDQSGAVGNFTLQIQFLDTKRGTPVKYLALPTTSQFSWVCATHSGKFLVRTGNTISLYSANFEQFLFQSLPLLHLSHDESWKIAVSPSGSVVYAEHDDNFGFGKGYKTASFLLDPDTLQVVERSAPATGPPWKVKATGSLRDSHSQPFTIVSSSDGRKLTVSLSAGNEIVSHEVNNLFFVAEVHRSRPDPFDIGINSKPVRIAVYDSKTQSERCSIPITKPVSVWLKPSLYSISPMGDLAVIDGNTLKMYQP